MGFVQVPVGIAGPVRIIGADTAGAYHAPFATCEPTLVVSCGQGCKVFNACGGLRSEVLNKAMSRALVFLFRSLGHVIAFARVTPVFISIADTFAKVLRAGIWLAKLHSMLVKGYGQSRSVVRLEINDFMIEGQSALDKVHS
ncbi:hydroxymethylglutaryl-coenzyme A reductase-domain-containing protein [Aspergillus arachidicola]|uniref:Hydroxymethylglutaryl-coenzyme A reductase-domain-containing protein n=1 Tax=Aspergillus arachidicola TaxID=656916 RepID=A0A5N6XME6_9EURO|nr:hydroxymethylglutaryl-coenzyme A reductase-domain-containing protein [Aspergillus arachidicola]